MRLNPKETLYMRTRFTLFALCLFVTAVASAQQIKVNKGHFDATGSAVLSPGVIGLDARFGAFVRDYRQVGFELGYNDTDPLSQTSIGAYYLHFIETNTYTLPYVGGGLGYNGLDADSGSDASGYALSLILGIRYYLTSSVALNTEFRAAWSSDETFIDGDEPSDTDFRLGVGLTYLW